ncbi:hypothetical protein BOMU111920_13655 [Bordetella muralis]
MSMCVLAFLLTGCYVTRKGEICSITMPQIFCDKEVYERATKPGRMVDRWDLSGRTVHARLQDWMMCGGDSLGDYWLAPLPNGEERTLDQERAASRAKVHSIQRCMMKKHYVYTGQCTSSVARESPPCRARVGEPWQ